MPCVRPGPFGKWTFDNPNGLGIRPSSRRQQVQQPGYRWLRIQQRTSSKLTARTRGRFGALPVLDARLAG
jgi:hypothetical protein